MMIRRNGFKIFTLVFVLIISSCSNGHSPISNSYENNNDDLSYCSESFESSSDENKKSQSSESLFGSSNTSDENGRSQSSEFSSDDSNLIDPISQYKIDDYPDFIFVLDDSGEFYSIEGYCGNDKELIIPESYCNIPIRKLTRGANNITPYFSIPKLYSQTVEKIFVSKNVSIIDASFLEAFSELAEIEVDFENQYFSSKNGILYSKNGDELIWCPSKLVLDVLKISYDVELISCPFDLCFNNVAAFNVSLLNESYSSVDGVLYSKNKETLLRYPVGKDASVFSIPDTVKEIGDSAFAYCSKLTSIELPDGLEEIGNKGFYYCESLANIKLPLSLKTIGQYCFYYTGLVSLELVDGLSSYYLLVYGCQNLKTISYPKTTSKIYLSELSSLPKLETILVDSENEQYASVDGKLYSKDLTELLFIPLYGKTKLYIEETIENINGVFLTHLDADENSIEEISVSEDNEVYSSYEGCLYNKDLTKLLFIPDKEHVKIADETQGISYNTKKTKIKTIDIGNACYYNLPDELAHIFSHENDVFEEIIVSPENSSYSSYEGCLYSKDLTELCLFPSNKKDLIFSSEILEIGYYAFSNCKLDSVVIPNGVEKISECAFYFSDCSIIEIPSSVKTISNIAFFQCDKLHKIKLNSQAELYFSSLTRFNNCNVQEVEISSDNENYVIENGLVLNKNMDTLICCLPGTTGEVAVPDTVWTIKEYAFRCCYNITSVTMPNHQISLATHTFYDCSNLRKIFFQGLTSIDSYAFYNQDWLILYFSCSEEDVVLNNSWNVSKDVYQRFKSECSGINPIRIIYNYEQ